MPEKYLSPPRSGSPPECGGRARRWIAMPKLSWSAFMERYPAAHLVAGVMPDNERITGGGRLQLKLIVKLIAGLALKGLYALTIDRQGRTPEASLRRRATR